MSHSRWHSTNSSGIRNHNSFLVSEFTVFFLICHIMALIYIFEWGKFELFLFLSTPFCSWNPQKALCKLSYLGYLVSETVLGYKSRPPDFCYIIYLPYIIANDCSDLHSFIVPAACFDLGSLRDLSLVFQYRGGGPLCVFSEISKLRWSSELLKVSKLIIEGYDLVFLL